VCVARRPPACMAESIIAELHGRLLRGIATETSVHYQGLRAAASHLRRSGLLSSKLAKKLAAVDCAFAISRHITAVSAEQCVHEVISAIAYEVKAAAEEKVAMEKVMGNAAEEEAIAKEKAFLEQAAANKVAEEEAKEKVAVEKAAEQQAAEERAAKEKTYFEQVAKEKAAAKDKADAEMAARAKAAEEQSAKEDAEHRAAVAKVLAKVGYCVPAPQFLELVSKEIKATKEKEATEELAEQVEKAGGVKTEVPVNPAGEFSAKGKAYGEKSAKKKADLEEAAVEESAVEGKAAKKAKVCGFAKVDMEIEALAYRIDSMGSSWEDVSWRRSGWR
jgi:hypothetical protein